MHIRKLPDKLPDLGKMMLEESQSSAVILIINRADCSRTHCGSYHNVRELLWSSFVSIWLSISPLLYHVVLVEHGFESVLGLRPQKLELDVLLVIDVHAWWIQLKC